MVLSNTTIYNDLLKALDTGMSVYLNDDGEYIMLAIFEYFVYNNTPCIGLRFENTTYRVMPSNGYSESELYTPSNIVIQVVEEAFA